MSSAELADYGYHTTVETNGTLYRNAEIDLVSISPKLRSSTPTSERSLTGEQEWIEQHEKQRIDQEALAALVDNYESQLKFVVTGADDMDEINQLIQQLRTRTESSIPNNDILLMPEGTTQEELDAKRNDVATLAADFGYRYTPRLHVNLWNDEPGT